MNFINNLIIGSGLAGLSCSYHLGHEKCLILESKSHPYGHIHSEYLDGFTWDEGPHVSFTKNDYVRDFFEKSVEGKYEEYEVTTGNYFNGHWISHPAQSNLYQVPQPLRAKCLESFLSSRASIGSEATIKNYKEWLYYAFGEVFAEIFPSAYTRKYWTVDPELMTTDWIGGRVFKPSIDDVINGSKRPLRRQTHYVKSVRYPSGGGYQAYAKKLIQGSNIRLNTKVVKIDLGCKTVWTDNGDAYQYKRLINSMPMPHFIDRCVDVPVQVAEASRELVCSSIQLVNVVAPHQTLRDENWMYVYDEDKLSVRVNCTEKLSPCNAPVGYTGVQVEVYHSRLKPLLLSNLDVENRVIDELIEMGIVCPDLAGGRHKIVAHSRFVPWANVVFHHDTRGAMDIILNWLSTHGLAREDHDLHPLTDWLDVKSDTFGDLILAGRFGQWKYFWTDDCLLRGQVIANNANS